MCKIKGKMALFHNCINVLKSYVFKTGVAFSIISLRCTAQCEIYLNKCKLRRAL